MPEGNDRATERGAGMRAALAEAGLALDDRPVAFGPIDLAAAAGMMRRLLASGRVHRHRGYQRRVRGRRQMACREAGVRITDELSITGARTHRPSA